MWTSGATDAGPHSSRVPPLTNCTLAVVYWLKTAIWQVGQRQIFCFLLSAGHRDRLRLTWLATRDAVGLEQEV